MHVLRKQAEYEECCQVSTITVRASHSPRTETEPKTVSF